MPREKITRHKGREYHIRDEEEKSLLLNFRAKTIKILQILEKQGLIGFVHGSIARGDVNKESDIDIHIPVQIPSFRLDLIKDFVNAERHIIMGTPNSTIRGVLSRIDKVSISFPLSPPRERENEFYRFSGFLYLDDIKNDRYVPGVTKELLLIEPDGNGYWISSVITNIARVIHVLSISQQMIDERIRVLIRRDKIGRTGLLLDYVLSSDENFEQALKRIADKNIIVRRMMKK
jgi:predicted nucleotidyltransferase